MNLVSWIETGICCPHCFEPLEVSRHYHGYSDEYSYYTSCSAACYIERGLYDDDTCEEITLKQYLQLNKI